MDGAANADGSTTDGATSDGATSDGATGDGSMGGLDGGLTGDDCAERAKWIYVVDSNDNFYRFEPNTLMFVQIGTGPLACPNTTTDSGVSHPFSMAVDEHAVAWVLYDDGDLYRVSTLDGTCEATAYVPGQLGFTRFGMGFASNGVFPNNSGETLYIARGLNTAEELGILNTTTLTVTFRAMITGVPELTGNANAQLWGFAPGTVSTVTQFNTTTGVPIATYDVSSMLSAGTRSAWAFAFWGGSYYIFYKTGSEPSTDVYKFTPGSAPDFALTRVIDGPMGGKRIVGAGVSTCAPIIIE